MAQINGNHNLDSTDVNIDTSTVIEALNLIQDPSTPNDRRLEASVHLERAKERPDVAEVGFSLGSDTNKPALVRHYGLSLLEHVVRHKWHHASEQHGEQLRTLILNLSETLERTNEAFIRNKIAELWIELAKRSWALDWFGLDDCLVQLWDQGPTCKLFVLAVLENLSEDIFVREDNTAVIRGRDLNSALVEIFTSPINFTGGIKIGDTNHRVRHGDEGWLARITQVLNECLQDNTIESTSKNVALACLATLRSVFIWVMTPSIVQASCLPAVCSCLTRQNQDLILAATDTLLALYSRARLEEIEVQALVYPLCQPENTHIFSQVFSWSTVSVNEVDTTKYVISKRISELVSHFTDWVIHFAPPAGVDFAPFLQFVVLVAQHESLIVSIPAVHAWDKVLQSSRWRRTDAVKTCVEPVLQFATQRIIAYDQLPEDTREPAVLFVNEEIEVHPERQGFFINYRRFCISIIDWITYTFLEDALGFLLTQVDLVLNELVAAESSFNPSQYSRQSILLLRADAHFTVVDAALRGVVRWQDSHKDQQHEQHSRQLTERVKEWAVSNLSNRNFRDPLIKERQVKHAVETSSRVLKADTGFAFSVLEYILSSFVPLEPEYPAYCDAVAELHSYASSELRRLALEHASYFVTFYDQLEAKFRELPLSSNADEKVLIDLKSTLFLIVQRAQGVAPDLRRGRLEVFLAPIGSAWAEHQDMLSSFENFTKAEAFDQIGPYLASSQAVNTADWTTIGFGADGAAVQKRMIDGSSQIPLRETRVLLSVSTERLEQDSDMHKMICELWAPLLPTILTNVLKLVSYNHLLHDTSNWPNVPLDLRITIQKVLRDRYWQSGISGGSMQEFHQKVKSTKSTMEGFASSVRGRIRTNLENCYSIIHTLGRLGSQFYSLSGVPEMISNELLETATPLGLHHFGTLLSMLPKLIEECPPENRQHFLTPVLATLLRQMDLKCSSEWQKLEQRREGNRQDDNLGDEMREESVLRQMTYRAVNMVAFWFDPQRELQLSKSTHIVNGGHNQSTTSTQTMRDFVLSNLQIIEPLLLFCTHAMAFRDTKACTTMVSALQKLTPIFGTETYLSGQEAAAVREFVSSEMLKTLITSLHDGYFADYQNHLATLIAIIWAAYGLPAQVLATETTPAHTRPAWTQTPRQVLLSLPGMTEAQVDAAGAQIVQEGGTMGRPRKLRAIVLQLLEGVRGVRLSELGKIDTKVQASKMMERYKMREAAGMQGLEGGAGAEAQRKIKIEDDGVDFGGLGNMFG